MRVALFAIIAPLFLFIAYHVLLLLAALWVSLLALIFGVVASVA